MLLVQRLPLGAQVPDFERESRRVERLRRQALSTLAQSDARMVLTKRFPALEFRQLLENAAESLHSGIRQHAGSWLQRFELAGSLASGLQLSCDERRLGHMQKSVNVLPRCVR